MIRRVVAQVIRKLGDQRANRRRILQDSFKFVHRTNRPRPIVVLQHAARAAGDIGGDIVDEHLLEPRRAARLHVRRLEIDLLLQAADHIGRQADGTVAETAGPRVEVVLVDGQRAQIGHRWRRAEAADLQHAGIVFEPHDVANAIEERGLRRVDANRAHDGDFAGRGGLDAVLHHFAALQIRELGRREPQFSRQHVSHAWRDPRCGDLRLDGGRAKRGSGREHQGARGHGHHLNVTAPANSAHVRARDVIPEV